MSRLCAFLTAAGPDALSTPAWRRPDQSVKTGIPARASSAACGPQERGRSAVRRARPHSRPRTRAPATDIGPARRPSPKIMASGPVVQLVRGGSGNPNAFTRSFDVDRREWNRREHTCTPIPGEESPGVGAADAKGRPDETFIPKRTGLALSAIDPAASAVHSRSGDRAASPRTPPDPAAAATPKPPMTRTDQRGRSRMDQRADNRALYQVPVRRNWANQEILRAPVKR